MDWKSLLLGSQNETWQIGRSPFDRDYDRIIFSHPFRKLQDKTQVHPLPEKDFVHNRLTHSLEVSSVARSLGRGAGSVILERHSILKEYVSSYDIGVITASAALAHDIGNPPFGHSGEDAISEFFISRKNDFEDIFNEAQISDLTDFEGNAQGFRLLNKSNYQGLRITNATLGAFTKYPRPSLVEDSFKPRKSQKKYGFFNTEKERFNSLALELGHCPLSNNQWARHPLAFLVEAADDICYHIIDLEDGHNLGLIDTSETIDLLAGVIGPKFDAEKLKRINSKEEKIALLRAMAIGELVNQCTELFLDNEPEILSGNFDKALTDNITVSKTLNDIQSVSISKIYRSEEVLEIEAAGYTVLNGILEAFMPYLISTEKSRKDKIVWRLIPENINNEIQSLDDTYDRVRVLLDFISGLTDRHAMSIYRKITGISLPGNR